MPLDIPTQPDLRVLLFTAGVALLTGVLFGLAPAWTASHAVPAQSLRDSERSGESPSRRLFARGLVVMQVALSMVLLSGAGLFVRHLSELRNVNLGFDRESVLLVTLDPARSGYAREQLASLYQQLLERFEAIPGVRGASLSGTTPIEGSGAGRFLVVPGFSEPAAARRFVSLNWVGPGYFETFGTRLIAGRDFSFADAGGAPVAIVNQAMARYYFGDGSAIGRRVLFETGERAYQIVGVVGDAKYTSLHEPAPRTMYLNAFQEGRGTFSHFALRTDVAPTSITGDVRTAVGELLQGVDVAKVTTLTDQVNASIVPERVIATLAGMFAGLGALLVAVGLYGLLSYTVSRRITEIGTRMALGATSGAVTRMMLKRALGLVCAGLAVGLPLALWSRRFAERTFTNLPADGAFPLAFAAAAMIVVGLLAAYVPARRAARVQPIAALRRS
jgi:putative ABC transport system permease protein